MAGEIQGKTGRQAAGGASAGDDQIRRFEELKKRHDALRDQKSKVEGQVQEQEKALDRLRKQAEEQFGTSDVAELEAMLAKLRAENEEKLRAYAEHLGEIETSLDALDEPPPAATPARRAP